MGQSRAGRRRLLGCSRDEGVGPNMELGKWGIVGPPGVGDGLEVGRAGE